MFNWFKKKSKLLQIKAHSPCGILGEGFSYVLTIPQYLGIPSSKTGARLYSPDYGTPSGNKNLNIDIQVVLEAIISDQSITRFIFSQKHNGNGTIILNKYHYEITTTDYLARRYKTNNLVLGTTHNLHIYFSEKEVNPVSDTDWAFKEFDKAMSILDNCHNKLFSKYPFNTRGYRD